MRLPKKNQVSKLLRFLPLLTLFILLAGIIVSVSAPPLIYSQVANAWNLQRDGSNNLNFFYSLGGVNPALQLKPDGTLNVNKISESARPDFYINLSGDSQFNTLKANNIVFSSLGVGTSDVPNYLGWPGAVNVNGQIKAARYYDDDPYYWLDLNADGILNHFNIRYISDLDNDNYQIDPNGISVLNQVNAGNMYPASIGVGTTSVPNYIGWPGAVNVNGQIKAARYYDDDPNYYMDFNAFSSLNDVQTSVLRTQEIYDTNSPGYLVNPGGQSRMNYTINDNIYAYGWMQAPIFYDADTNAYRLDPNGISVLNQVNAGNMYPANIYLPWIDWLSNVLNQSVAVDSSPNFTNPSVNNIWFEPWGNWISTFLNSPSDQRLKKNIQNMTDDAAKKLDQLQSVSFEWINKSPETGFEQEKGTKYGFIAQDIEKIFPDMVMTDGNGYKSIHYEQITALLVKSVQDLKKQNQELTEQNNQLKNRLDLIDSEISRLKQK